MADSKQIVIIGTGPFAQVAKDYLEELSEYQVVAFACHQEFKTTDSMYGLPLFAIEEIVNIYPPIKYDVFVALGYKQMNKVRGRVYAEIKEYGYRCISFIHPDVKIWSSTEIGENVFIFEDNTIQPYTIIGDNTILWSGNHIGHHSRIGDHCFISSHVVISGFCKIGNNVFIGVNSTLHDNIQVGDECLIGAGALISKNTNPKEVYVAAGTKLFPKNSEQVGF